MADILKFTETPIIDESIEEYEYHEYEPITDTSLNNAGDVRISIESQDDTTTFGLLKYPDDFSKAQGRNQLWNKDTATTAVKADNNGFAARNGYLIQSPTVKCIFSFRIPMNHIFDFCEDYDKLCMA